MTNTDQRRWHQRLDRFGAALAQLDKACNKDSYTDLERAGLMLTFMFCYELGWKVLKDLLHYEGHDSSSPREAIRKSFESGYIGEEDCETFLDALSRRNLLTHTYSDTVAESTESLIKHQYHPMLRRLWRELEQKISE